MGGGVRERKRGKTYLWEKSCEPSHLKSLTSPAPDLFELWVALDGRCVAQALREFRLGRSRTVNVLIIERETMMKDGITEKR